MPALLPILEANATGANLVVKSIQLIALIGTKPKRLPSGQVLVYQPRQNGSTLHAMVVVIGSTLGVMKRQIVFAL